MKKDQAIKFTVGGLLCLLTLVVGSQWIGGGKAPEKTRVATPVSPSVTPAPVATSDPVVARDVFWHPALAKDLPPPTKTAVHLDPAPSMPLPQPMSESTTWVPPLSPPVGNIEVTKEKPKPTNEKPVPVEPKKVLSVCGFLATQTPKIILSLNSEDPMPYGKGEKPCAEITILAIGMDQATLQLPNRKITVTAGEKVEI